MALLDSWVPPSPAQARLQSSYLAHLRTYPDALSRHCHPDHLTASALVVSAERDRVLLNLHRRYGIWVQFGGHCEPTDATLAAAALRESEEESGITGLQLVAGQPAQLSRHEVRCGPVRPSHHLDVRWIAVAPPGAEPTTSPESLEVRWFAVTALPTVEPEVRELIQQATGC